MVKLKNGRVLQNKCRVKQSAKLLAKRKAAKAAGKKPPSRAGKRCTVQSAQYKLSHHRKGGAKRKRATGAARAKKPQGLIATIVEEFHALTHWFMPAATPVHALPAGSSHARQLSSGAAPRQLGPGARHALPAHRERESVPASRQLGSGR